jgi:hypothetical protein
MATSLFLTRVVVPAVRGGWVVDSWSLMYAVSLVVRQGRVNIRLLVLDMMELHLTSLTMDKEGMA